MYMYMCNGCVCVTYNDVIYCRILGRGKGTSVIRSSSPLIKWKLIREQDGEMKSEREREREQLLEH